MNETAIASAKPAAGADARALRVAVVGIGWWSDVLRRNRDRVVLHALA
jgi:hypothetical protein